MSIRSLASAAAIGLALASASASALEIDVFDGTGPFTFDGPQAGTAVGTSSNAFGRTLDITTSGTDTNVQIDTGTNPGVFAHSQDSGVTGTSQINYALGGIDLTDGGNDNAFRLELVNIDLGGVLGIIVDGVTSTLTSTSIIIDNGGALPSFADFLFSGFVGPDFTNVNTVSLLIDGSAQDALDASIDAFETVCSTNNSSGGSGTNPSNNPANCNPPANVPVPSSLLLMSIALFGFGYNQRRRNKA